ncbi:uncharacterized protein LOC121935138 [Sceloporus undulatus]|uniref:uncharacterized protein LOC121935138 n=1 Tax=Sceloporus undulatus TaxID=8520 RepID=UPI001C4ADCD9|nr:uncharacterized protein LOC121935138 [Sceloporus undulatus]
MATCWGCFDFEGHRQGRERRIVEMEWLCNWCRWKQFGFLDYCLWFYEDRLLASDGLHLTAVDRNVFAMSLKLDQEGFKLSYVAEGDSILDGRSSSSAGDNNWNVIQRTSKRNDKEMVGPLCGEDGEMLTEDREKMVFNTFCTLVISQKKNSAQPGENGTDDADGDMQHRIGKEVAQEYLASLKDELHPRVLKELADIISEPLEITFQNSWRTGEVSADWRRPNVVSILKKLFNLSVVCKQTKNH